MKKLYTLLCLIFSLSQLHAQSFKWVDQIGGTDYDTGEDIAFDSAGNVYMVGIFNTGGDFNPDTSDFYLINSLGAQDVYVVKLDSGGHFKWAVSVGGAEQDFAYSIAVSNTGFVYVCGTFRSTVDFNPGAGTFEMTSAGESDIFMLKLDTASNFIWARQIGDLGDEKVERFILDNSGNMMLCGEFSGPMDFDPGFGVEELNSTGAQDAYVAKYDDQGNYIWAYNFGSNSGELAQSLAVDVVNGVYVTGEFYGTIDFDPGPYTHTLINSGFNANIFVFKWDSSGNYVWADNIGNSTGGDQGIDITTDIIGNPIVVGSFFGTVDFDPGLGTYNLTSTGNGDIFVLKLESAFGILEYAVHMGGTTLDQPYSVAINSAGDIFLTGLFSGTADFDPGSSAYNIDASGPSDIFMVQLDNSGNLIWANGFGGLEDDFGRGIAVNGTDVYTCGVFSFTPDFDPGSDTYYVTSFSLSPDAFLLKLRFCTPSETSAIHALCPGDSVYVAGAWQHEAGTYYDYYTSASGCDSIVTTLVHLTFELDLGNDIYGCNGAAVHLYSGVSNATYLWSTGDTLQSISVSATGIYSVSVTKQACTLEDSVYVEFHDPIIVYLGTDTTICNTTQITIDAGAGYSSYTWQDGSSGETFTVDGSAGAGDYEVAVTVIDSFGCITKDTMIVTVTICNGVYESEQTVFHISPNPASDILSINAAENIIGITIYDLAGRRIMDNHYYPGRKLLELPLNLNNGVYWLNIKGEESSGTFKLLIQK